MSCSKKDVCPQMEEELPKISRFAIVPILRGKTNSAVTHRIVAALQKSSFCSSNPVIKKLIIQNVQVWCIVIETSGTQSIKVICASAPFLLRLLCRANPKLKQILQDEKVASYLKYFQETDLESLLESVCAATIIIQKGIRLCQPTLCVQLSRDALMFGNVTFKALWNMIYNGMVSAFQFLWEDLGPIFHSFCSRNRDFVKYVARNLPVLALAGAKSLVIFSLFLRRLIHGALRAFKRFVKTTFHLLQESSFDYTMIKFRESLYAVLINFSNFLLSGSLYQYCKCVCVYSEKWCKICVKKLLPYIWSECLNFVRSYFPVIKKYSKLAIQSASTIALLFEKKTIEFIKFCYNSKSVLKNLLLTIMPYYHKLYKLILSLVKTSIGIELLIRPHFKKYSIYALKNLISLFVYITKCSILIANCISNIFSNGPEICPMLQNLFINVFKILNYTYKFIVKLSKAFFIYLKNILPTLYADITPLLLPIAKEIQSTLTNVSSEVITKTYSGVKRTLPSLWQSFQNVSPPVFHASQEFFITSKQAAIIVYPALLELIITIRPEMYKAIVVLMEDGNNAFLEVATVSFAASRQFVLAAENVSNQLPIVCNAINEVTIATSSAVTEVSISSLKAQARVLRDLKMAVLVVRLSLKSAELELVAVVEEVALEVNGIVSDTPDLQNFINTLTEKGLLLSLSASRNAFGALCAICAYSACQFHSRSDALKNLYDVLKIYLSKYKKQMLTYLSNLLQSSDPHSVYEAVSYLCNVLNLPLIYDNLETFVTPYLRYAWELINRYTCNACSELIHNVAPKSWKFIKCLISLLWETITNLTSESWLLFELISAKTWCFICKKFPEIWLTFKTVSEATWINACKVAPELWSYTLTTAPVIWSSNRYLIKAIWNLYVDTCLQTWNHTVPLSSNTWSYAVDISPKIWISLSEHSKVNWKIFCYAAENSWEIVTDTSTMSWELFNKIVSKSWHCGIRPVTTSVCCNTSTILVNSLKVSFGVYAKTGKIICFLYDELSDKSFPFINFDLLSSKLEESVATTQETINKCIDSSPLKLLKPGTKRKFLRKTLKNLIRIPYQISGTYSNYLTFDNMVHNFNTISKIPFVPVSCSYALGQLLLKKYTSTFPLLEKM